LQANAPWWQVLGLSPQASIEEIKSTRVRLAKLYHPDAGIEADHAKMAAVNAACDVGIAQRKAGA